MALALLPPMYSHDVPLPLVVVILLALLLFLSHIRSPKHSLTLPGPRPVPVLGNLHQLGSNWSETFRRWSTVYGPVFAIRIGERPVLVINSPRAAKALFVDQGGAYISRPWFHTFHNVLSAKGKSAFTIGTSPWDASCKDRRRAAATALNKPCVQSYTPIIEVEALALLRDLLAHGQAGIATIDPYKYFQRLALNTSLFVNYGTRMEDINDKLFQEITEVTHKVAGVRAVTGSFQDFLPILRVFSNLFWRKNAEAVSIAARRKAYMDELLDSLMARIASNTDRPCITGNILRDPDNKLDRKEVMSICMSMVSAGLDTFANTMIWTTGLLALRPDLQHKAYASILATHPPNTPPDPYTESSPYIIALAKEASRYFNVFRLSLPRCTVKESHWEGHVIPEGTTVFLNAWACNMDEELYENADTFKPERFLDGKSAQDADGNGTLGPSTYAFGMGRRACPGVHLAMREMYVTLSCLVYYFEIVPADEEGIDVHPVKAIENNFGFSMAPKRFNVRFVPREENLERLMKALALGGDV